MIDDLWLSLEDADTWIHTANMEFVKYLRQLPSALQRDEIVHYMGTYGRSRESYLRSGDLEKLQETQLVVVE
jgi:hypothetical protein